MSDSTLHLSWDLPASGPVIGQATEGYVPVAEGFFAADTLMSRRPLVISRSRKGVPRRIDLFVEFDKLNVRVTEPSGVPFADNLSPPPPELTGLLDKTANGLMAGFDALTDPGREDGVAALFPVGMRRMRLAFADARGPLLRALRGRRFDRTANRTALTDFVTTNQDTTAEDAPNSSDDAEKLDRLRAVLAIMPRLIDTEVKLIFDREQRSLRAAFLTEQHVPSAPPSIQAHRDPPGLTANPGHYTNATAFQRAIAVCEVTRFLRLALFLYPVEGWHLECGYAAKKTDGGLIGIYSRTVLPNSSLLDLFGR